MIFYDSNNEEHELPPDRKTEWRISGYAIVQNAQNDILLVTPTWRATYDMPGGGIEPAESIEEGIVRECYEETGYKIRLSERMPIHISETNFYWSDFDSYRHSVNFFYKAELASPEQNKEAINVAVPNEISKVEWVNLDSITKENCHFMYLPAIELLRQNRHSTNNLI